MTTLRMGLLMALCVSWTARQTTFAEDLEAAKSGAAAAAIKGMEDPDAGARLDAVKTLDRLLDPDQRGKGGFPAGERLAAALERLGPAGKQIVPALARALKDDDARVRTAAASLIGCLGPTAAACGPAVLDATKDKDFSVRMAAIHATANLGFDTKTLVGTLASAAKDTEPRVRTSAMVLLAGVVAHEKAPDHGAVQSALHALADGLKDQSEDVRMRSARALWSLGAKAEPLAPALKSALGDSSRAVRLLAAGALLKLSPGDKGLTEALAKELPAFDEMLHASGSTDVVFAAQVLAMLGAKAEPSVPALLDVIETGRQDGGPEGAARRAILKIGPAAAPALRRETGSQDPHRRIVAAGLLGRIAPGDRICIEALSQALKDEDKNIRSAAARELWALGTSAKAAAGALRAALEDKEPEVRKVAAEALERVQGSQ